MCGTHVFLGMEKRNTQTGPDLKPMCYFQFHLAKFVLDGQMFGNGRSGFIRHCRKIFTKTFELSQWCIIRLSWAEPS